MAPRKTAPSKADPFAESAAPTEPADEAQTEIPSNTIKPKENITLENTDTGNGLSVTLKGGAGFDAPWVVIRTTNVEDALGLLNDDNLVALLDKASDRGAYFASKGASTGGGGGARKGGGGGGGRPSGPAAATEHPDGKEEFCAHGKMTFVSGVSKKTGNQWQAFDCPDEVCDRKWDNNKK